MSGPGGTTVDLSLPPNFVVVELPAYHAWLLQRLSEVGVELGPAVVIAWLVSAWAEDNADVHAALSFGPQHFLEEGSVARVTNPPTLPGGPAAVQLREVGPLLARVSATMLRAESLLSLAVGQPAWWGSADAGAEASRCDAQDLLPVMVGARRELDQWTTALTLFPEAFSAPSDAGDGE